MTNAVDGRSEILERVFKACRSSGPMPLGLITHALGSAELSLRLRGWLAPR